MAQEPSNNGSKTKYVLLGVGVLGGACIAGYFIYQHYKGNNIAENSEEDFDDALRTSEIPAPLPPVAQTNYSTSTQTSSQAGTFPLKQGSNGPLVADLQQALITIHGSQILPKYGADGDWGTETSKALKAKHNLSVVNLPEFTRIKKLAHEKKSGGNFITNAITAPVEAAVAVFQAPVVATALLASTKAKNFTGTLAMLKQITSVGQYVAVNTIFKAVPFDGLRRFTLVSACLETFKETKQREAITQAFRDMGLKEREGVWSLSGLKHNPSVETLCSTYIWDGKGIEIEVPAGTTLGQLVQRDQEIVRFRTVEGADLYVLAETVHED